MSMVPDDLNGDVLRGGARITQFLQALLGEPELSQKKVYYWIATGRIPAGKLGTDVIASKTALRKRYAQVTGRAVG
jgi:hypothetical protein